LITFASADAAVSALQDAQRGHASHSKAARELAHEVFGHRPVLTSLLARAGIDPA
jgi:hypothetical protein